MKIQNTGTIPSQTTFKAWRREVSTIALDSSKEILHRNDTCFFRDNKKDYNFWARLIDLLSEKFKNSDKVNIYNYACSNGSEAYTFLMQLFSSKDKEFAQKFTPIIAKDYDPEAIKMAKSGKLPIQSHEVERIQTSTNGKFREFFDAPEDLQFIGKESLDISLNKEYSDLIDFSVANIIEDYETIQPKDSFVFARNFLPYLKDKSTVRQLIKDLGNHLDEGSYLAVGEFDHRGLFCNRINLKELLEVAGFKPTSVKNVYEKKAKPSLGLGFLTHA
jgi:chemotaxis methyl-accepting protein methylase